MLRSQLFVWILMVVFICLAIYLFFLHIVFEETFLKLKSPHNDCTHGVMMLSGTVSMSVAMLVYRLFRGERTRLIKYVHMGCHTVAVILLIVGYISAPDVMTQYNQSKKNHTVCKSPDPSSDKTNLKSMSTVNLSHFTIGYMVLGAIAIQYIVALFIFVYLYENQKLRLYCAPFHDIFGIWIFLTAVACYLTGNYMLYNAQSHLITASRGVDLTPAYKSIALPAILTFLVVMVVVLNPYFEWELVGDI